MVEIINRLVTVELVTINISWIGPNHDGCIHKVDRSIEYFGHKRAIEPFWEISEKDVSNTNSEYLTTSFSANLVTPHLRFLGGVKESISMQFPILNLDLENF